MKKSTLIAASITTILSTSTLAKDGYLGAEISQFDTKIEFLNSSFDFKPKTITFFAGKHLNEHVSLEGKLGSGVIEDDADFFGRTLDFEVESILSLEGKAKYMLTNAFGVATNAGLTRVAYSDSDGDDADALGLSYGASILFRLNEKAELYFSYKQLPDGDYDDFDIKVESKAISVGANLQF